MSRSAKRPATYDDLLQVPEHLVAEIVDGELITSPRPAPRHAHVGAALLSAIHNPFHQGQGGPGGWWILFEPELHVKNDVLVPDIAGWRRERLPALPDTAFFTTAPDWLCEILSPSTEQLDRARKMRIYARERVKNVWLVHPVQRTLEVYGLVSGVWAPSATHRDDDVASIEPFDGTPLELTRLWTDTAPEPGS
jgi:Uma2 family endonuclease